MAAPIRDERGRAVAAISVSGPAIRITRQRIEDSLKDEVMKTALEISRKMGFRGKHCNGTQIGMKLAEGRQVMEIRYPAHPEEFRAYTSERIRRDYLIENLFEPGKIRLVYSHSDRIIVGGVCPTASAVPLEAGKELGAEFFLARREMGVINIGGGGTVTIDGKGYDLGRRDGLYVGMGAKEIAFASADSGEPAKFYCNSAPAHKSHPTRAVSMKEARRVRARFAG